MSNSALQNVYTGASDFGKFTSVISAVFSTLIGLVFIAVGIYLIIEDNARQTQIQGDVQSVNCPSPEGDNDDITPSKGRPENDCLVNIQYKVDKKNFNKNFAVSSNTSLKQGDKVTLFVDPSNPKDNIVLGSNNNSETIAGLVLISAGAFIILVGWLIVYFSYKYKFFSAVEGTSTAIKYLT